MKGWGKNWAIVWTTIDMNMIATGNTKAVNEAYELLKPSVYYNMYTWNELDQEEIYNNFFTDWCKGASKFNPEKGKLFTWTFRIARNSEINYLKRKENKNKPLLSINNTVPGSNIMFDVEDADIFNYENWTQEEIKEADRRIKTLSKEEKEFIEWYMYLKGEKRNTFRYKYNKIIAKLKKLNN